MEYIGAVYLLSLFGKKGVNLFFIRAVQALAGGSGSGLRLTAGEIMASTMTLADSADSVETANNKISGLLKLLDTNIANNFPYTAGGQPGSGAGATTGGVQGGQNQIDSLKAKHGITY